MVPRAILMKSYLVSVNTARQIQASDGLGPQKKLIFLSNVQGNPQMDLQDHGVIDSRCSRHMTGNMSYLTNYEEIDGGYVAVGRGLPLKQGIMRQFSVARTPQQNRVAERRNRTLIEVVRTMLANSKLTTTFWAKAVNTACYVQNRVLVVKPHNKTTYELFHSRTPTLSFIRPFGCPVTILNTIDHLGKFDGKADEGFFVGYSLNSKSFRVFNSRTRIVEENLHIRFSKSTPNVVGTKASDNAGQARKEREPSYHDDGSKPSSDDEKKVDEDPRQESECNDQEKEDNVNSTNNVNAAGTNEVNAVGGKTTIELPFDPNMPSLEDYRTFDFSRDDEDDGVEADINNLDTTIQVSPIPTTRIHKDHPLDQVIEDLQSKTFKTACLLAFYHRKNPKRNLHQAPRAWWYETLSTYLLDNRFQRGKIDKTLFMKWHKGKAKKSVRLMMEKLFGMELELIPAKTINEEVQLHALVDGKKIVVIEAFVRRDLKLEDEECIDCLPNSAIFEQLTLMGSKTTAWNEFSSSMASAIICSATNQKFNFSKYIFEIMIRNLDNVSGKFLMYPRPRKPKRKDTQVPQPSDPSENVADEAAHKELGDSLVRVATAASSLEAEQDSAKVESSGDEEDLGEDATKQGRRINAIDADKDITLVNVQDDADNEMFDMNVLNSEEVFVSRQNENVVEEVVDAAQVSTTATTVTITTEEITLAQALKALKTSKPKVKGIVFQEPSTTITITSIYSQQSQDKAEFDEEERLAREKAEKEKEANIALIKEWDDIQAKIDADHQLAESLQAQEQEELSDAEKATLFQQLLEKRRKHFAAKRAKEKRNKPPTQAQQRKIMCTYDLKLKDFDSIQEMFDGAFKRVNTFEDFRTKLVEGKEKRVGEELIQKNEEEVAIDVIPLVVKSPRIVDWKIHKEGKKSYYQIIRADGKSQMYRIFSQMIKSFDMEDLEDLYKLVKARYGSTRPMESMDYLLWNDMKIMFEPHVEDEVWKLQNGYKVLEWKLYDSCRLKEFDLLKWDPTGAAKRWVADFPQELSIPEISLRKLLSKGTVRHPRPLSSLKTSLTLSRKATKHYTRHGKGIMTCFINVQLMTSIAIRRNIYSDNSNSDGIAAIVNKLDSLGRDMKKLKENVHAIQVGCQTCERAHLDKECPLNKEVKSVEERKEAKLGRAYEQALGGVYTKKGWNGRMCKETLGECGD
ncbi:ribonuclease H-like domain-containing protein [Tanacetum coccineum]